MLKNQLDFITRYYNALKTFSPFVSSSLKQKFLFVVAIVFGVVATNTMMIWMIGKPFDHLLQQDFSGLTNTLLFLALVIIVNQFFHYQSMYNASVLGLRFVGELRNYCVKQLCVAETVVTDKLKKGDVLTRLSADIDFVQRLMIESPLYFVSHILTLIFYSGMLLIIDWQLALIAFLLAPLFFLHQTIFAKPKGIASREFLAENGKLLANEDEILTNLRSVKVLNAIRKISTQNAQYFDRAFKWAVKERKLNASFNASLALMIYLCALFIVFLGVGKIENNSLSVAELVSFLISMGYLSVPIRGIADLGFQVQADIMAGDRLLELLNMPQEKNDRVTWRADKGAIAIESLSFSTVDKNIFNDISVLIQAGKSYAIVGESGVGKSTLAQLLLGFKSADKGSICIDGKSVLEVNKCDLRESVGVVWQNPMLFSDSIRNNLLLARENATQSEIEQALKQADAWGFVQALPNGLDTIIGSHSHELSGGQKQRLQIAQAILRDPVILILDEATSALDSQAEENVLTHLQSARQNKTTLIITHRYSAIKHVGEIIYLNGDGSVTQGTHEQLIATHSGYQHAIKWQTQTSEY